MAITHLSEQNRRELSRQERTRILQAIKKGQEAFWATVMDELPEIQARHLTPEIVFSFDYGCEYAVSNWYRDNKPQGQNKLNV